MILVDSSVWIDFFNGRDTRQTDLLDGLLGEEEVLAWDLIYVEVLRGFRRDENSSARSMRSTRYPWLICSGARLRSPAR